MAHTHRSSVCHEERQNTFISCLSIQVLKWLLNRFPSRPARRPDTASNKAPLTLTLCHLICTLNSVWASWYLKLKEPCCSSLLNLNYMELLSVNMQLRQYSCPLQATYQHVNSRLMNAHRKCELFIRYSWRIIKLQTPIPTIPKTFGRVAVKLNELNLNWS